MHNNGLRVAESLCADWAGVRFHRLAKPGPGGPPGAGLSLGTGCPGLPQALCLLTRPPGLQDGRSRGRQDGDLGFQLNCQCRENLGGSVRCPAPGRTVRRATRNREAGQREGAERCQLCSPPRRSEPRPPGSALSECGRAPLPGGACSHALPQPFTRKVAPAYSKPTETPR